MQTCTQDYKALVMDGTVAATNADDTVKWYKASKAFQIFALASP